MAELRLKPILFLAALFIAGSLLIYSGVAEHDLLNWDDRSYTVNNPWVTNPSPVNLVSLFTQSRMANWHPLTWLSFIPEYALCADKAICYKTTNAVLHGLVSLLVVLLCATVFSLAGGDRKSIELAGKFSLPLPLLAGMVAGVMFLVHPQHVESVTWVAQRKDLLCALFYFAALLAYLKAGQSSYVERYGLCFLFFVLAAMSKSMAVSLPAVLILLDVFLLHPGLLATRNPGEVVRLLIFEKMPFLVAMILLMVLTLDTQSAAAYAPLTAVEKMAYVFSGLQHYLLTFLLPLDLSPFYPASLAQLTLGVVVVAILFLVLTVLATWMAIGQQKYSLLALALLFFLVSVAPVSGLVRIGEQAFADRYSYIPLLGLYGLLAWVVCTVAEKVRSPAWVLLPFAAYLLILGLISTSYKHSWRDDVTFWTTVTGQYPDGAAMPWDNLANALAVVGEYNQAIATYQRSIELQPNQDMSYINLAAIQQFTGDGEAAIETLRNAVEVNRDSPALLSRAGRALLLGGAPDEAEPLLERAISIRPDLPDTLLSLGLLRKVQGRQEEALQLFADIPVNMPQHYEANLQILELSIERDPTAAFQQLVRMRQIYGDTDELTGLAGRLERAQSLRR